MCKKPLWEKRTKLHKLYRREWGRLTCTILYKNKHKSIHPGGTLFNYVGTGREAFESQRSRTNDVYIKKKTHAGAMDRVETRRAAGPPAVGEPPPGNAWPEEGKGGGGRARQEKGDKTGGKGEGGRGRERKRRRGRRSCSDREETLGPLGPSSV
jgi:hypothetical protein